MCGWWWPGGGGVGACGRPPLHGRQGARARPRAPARARARAKRTSVVMRRRPAAAQASTRRARMAATSGSASSAFRTTATMPACCFRRRWWCVCLGSGGGVSAGWGAGEAAAARAGGGGRPQRQRIERDRGAAAAPAPRPPAGRRLRLRKAAGAALRRTQRACRSRSFTVRDSPMSWPKEEPGTWKVASGSDRTAATAAGSPITLYSSPKTLALNSGPCLQKLDERGGGWQGGVGCGWKGGERREREAAAGGRRRRQARPIAGGGGGGAVGKQGRSPAAAAAAPAAHRDHMKCSGPSFTRSSVSPMKGRVQPGPGILGGAAIAGGGACAMVVRLVAVVELPGACRRGACALWRALWRRCGEAGSGGVLYGNVSQSGGRAVGAAGPAPLGCRDVRCREGKWVGSRRRNARRAE